MEEIKARASELWEGLSSKQRMAAMALGSCSVIAIAALFVKADKDASTEEIAIVETREIVNEGDILARTLAEKVDQDLNDQRDQTESVKDLLRQQGEDIAAAIASLQDELAEARRQQALLNDAAASKQIPELPDRDEEGRASEPTYPPAPIQGVAHSAPISLTGGGGDLAPILVGGIATAQPASGVALPGKADLSQGESVYLPAGMMDAILLTGVDTLASGGGTSNPEPIILRVQAPAVLPNHVRGNLQGCFVIGNATGSLAKERVEVRAVSLSCIDYDERAVIDENIKGFLVDMDGKKGLSGKVVTKAGALLGRSFLAGILEGFGEGLNVSAGTRTVSPLGEVQSFDSGDIAQAGLGGGLSTASEQLSRYYLELARETVPVIEVGAAKEVVLVIQEGVQLNIRRDVDVIQ